MISKVAKWLEEKLIAAMNNDYNKKEPEEMDITEGIIQVLKVIKNKLTNHHWYYSQIRDDKVKYELRNNYAHTSNITLHHDENQLMIKLDYNHLKYYLFNYDNYSYSESAWKEINPSMGSLFIEEYIDINDLKIFLDEAMIELI